jgi:diacylglycerol kinase (ATP)
MQTNPETAPKTFVVMNPVAGQREAQEVQEMIESKLRAQGVPFEIYTTKAEENVREVVEAALKRGFKMVMAAGGDGTISAAASAVVDKEACLGIIPSGTWNALARNLDIPLDLEQALDLALAQPATRTIDMLEVDGHFYVLNVSVGVGSELIQNIEREEIRRLGRFTYILRGTMQLVGYPPFGFRTLMDGKPVNFRASELIVANSGVIGMKNMRLDLGIHMDDGKINACRIYARNLWDYAALGYSMLTGGQRNDPRVVCWELNNEIRIDCRKKLAVQADGEMIGRLPVTVKIRPSAVKIIIPPRPEQ